jgi:hypothetical protein
MKNGFIFFGLLIILPNAVGCTISLGESGSERSPHAVANQPWCSPGSRAVGYVERRYGPVASHSWVEWECGETIVDSRSVIKNAIRFLKRHNQWTPLLHYSGTPEPGIVNNSDVANLDAILLIVCVDPVVVLIIEGETIYIRGIGYDKYRPHNELADNLLSHGFSFGTTFSSSSDQIRWFADSADQIHDLEICTESISQIELISGNLEVSYKRELGLYSVELVN